MKKIKIIFAMSIFLFLPSFSVEKYVIGGRAAGFFSNFLSTLMHLIGCKKNRLVPVVYWDQYCPYYVDNGKPYNNVWEYYFEPVSNLDYKKGDELHRYHLFDEYSPLYWLMPDYVYNFDYTFRKKMNSIIREYVKIKKHIPAKVNFFYKKYMKGKKIIGVHVRGTDKKLENIQPSLDSFLKIIDKYKECHILIASDEYAIVEKFKKRFHGRVICYDAHRSLNSTPVHNNSFITSQKNPLNAILGEEVLIEAILLSKCDLFVHSVSNVATAVLFFNPKLKHIFLDPNKV